MTHTKMWFGTQHHSQWVRNPLAGADMSPQSWGTEGTFLSGGGFVRQSQDSHRQYIFEYAGSSSREDAEIMQAYRDGAFSMKRTDLIYFHDPLTYSRNILPKRWAQPNVLAPIREGVTSVSPIGRILHTIENSDAGSRSLGYPFQGVRVQGITSAEFALADASTRGVLWIPIPPGMELTLTWAGVPGPGSLFYRTPEGSPEMLSLPVPNKISGVSGVYLGVVGEFDFYGARAFLGRGDEDFPLEAFHWIGEKDKSGSIRAVHSSGAVDINVFTNPDMSNSSGEVTVWENLLPFPDPSTESSRFTHTGDLSFRWDTTGTIITANDRISGVSTTFFRTSSSNGVSEVGPGEVYSARGAVTNLSSWPISLRFGMIRTPSASLVVSSARTENITLQPGEYREISIEDQETDESWTTVRVGWVAPSTGFIPEGSAFKIHDGITVMKGEAAPTLVPLSYSPDPDLTPQPRPGGGAQLVGRSPARIGNNTSTRRAVISESVRTSHGQNTLKLIVPEYNSTTTPYGVTLTGSTEGGQGTKITIAAWCYIPEGYDDTEDIARDTSNRKARSMYVYSGGTGSLEAGYAQAPATPGWHLVKAHVDLGEDIGDNAVRLTPSYKPGQPVYWGTPTVVHSPSFQGTPFSGSYPWKGTRWLPGSGHSGCAFVGNPTWIANSGVHGGQIGFAATLKEVGDWQQ